MPWRWTIKVTDDCRLDPLTGKESCCRDNGDGTKICTEKRTRSFIPGSWIVVAMISIVLILLIPFSATLSLDIERDFDIDYLIFDGMFLVAYVILLLVRKKWFPTIVAAIFAAAIYFIDGVVWWFLGIREISPAELKIFVDFMMNVSYGLVAFSWLVIVLRGDKDAIYWTAFLFGGWLSVAFASQLIPFWDTTIFTVRHMQTTNLVSIVVIIAGYVLLACIMTTPKDIIKTFGFACLLGFFMEFSLWSSGIRPSGLDLVFYDTIVLINQGAPYIYVMLARIVPAAAKLPKIIGFEIKGEFAGIESDL